MSVQYVYPLKGNPSHRLLIDKLSLTIKPKQWEVYSDYKNTLYQFSQLPDLPIVYDPSAKTASYSGAYRIKLNNLTSEDWPLLQVATPKPNKSFLRLEFNPDHLGTKGIKEFKTILDQWLLPHGYPSVLKWSRITRIDLAVDFVNVSLDQIFPKTKWPTYMEMWSHKGELESIYLGKRSQTNNFYRIYEKSIGHPPKKKVLRVEREMRNLKIAFGELQSLPNPFSTLHLNHLDMPPPKEWDTTKWRLFVRVLKFSGLNSALLMLPPAERKVAKLHVAKFSIHQMDLGAIWSEWPSILQKTGLLEPGPQGSSIPFYNEAKIDDPT